MEANKPEKKTRRDKLVSLESRARAIWTRHQMFRAEIDPTK